MRTLVAAVLALSVLAVAPAGAGAAEVPPGAEWQEVQIPSTDGVTLHGDILRPKGLAAGAKTPVILSVGPYFNHSGQTGPAGPVQGTPYDPIGPSAGPSDRFSDFVNGARLMERGYTFVMVDLRGFGGSSGCLDWGGPGEQADVQKAVEWAAGQPWSTGSVGMYGKSYDGVTGLIGANKRPAGLKAVVAQEPVYDLYRYLYGDGMRRVNSGATPALYNLISLTPGPLLDPGYNLGAADLSRPGCHAQNQIDQSLNDDHGTDYWKQRSLIPGAAGSDVPLFLTQGLTENNTVADGMAQYLENHTGPEQGWLGPWEHVRGNDTDADGRLKMGRAGWFDETIRFYDRYLKGVTPAVRDPKWAVQTNDGKWFAAASWKAATSDQASTLKTGAYTDDASGVATGSGSDEGIWTVSPPLATEAHLSGSGKVTLNVTKPALGNGNLVVDVYDLGTAANGDLEGPLVTRQGHLIRENGTLTLDLWSADWKIAPGHRIGVRITDANDDWWLHTGLPTGQPVTVTDASISLPFLTTKRTQVIQGDPGVQLEGYLADKATLPQAKVAAAESPGFALPPAQGEPSAAENDSAFTSAATAD